MKKNLYLIITIVFSGCFYFWPSVLFGQSINEDLIPVNAEWKYLDNGSDQGTGWRANSFDDSGWASGNAELGYGDGDETTVVSFGPDEDNKYITTYFRKSFNITNASSFTDLELQLLRDDGAVVYLNGTEIFRSNMPSGTITYTTDASGTVSGSEEDAFFLSPVNPSLLVDGENVVAVEIHQRSVSSSDISFNFRLTGNREQTTTCEPPTNLSATNITTSSATLSWNAASFATSYTVEYKETTAFAWFQNNTSSTSLNISGLSASTDYEFRVRTQCDDSTSTFSPAFTFTTLSPSTGGDTIAVELIPVNAEWKYLDNGSDQGTGWRATSFDDAGWASGNAELGYGDGDEATVVSYGPDKSNKYITTYFRKSFDISNASSFTDLELQLLRDDGAIVYLNGTEVFRSNMPSGIITYTTEASGTASGSEEDAFFPSSVNPALLVDGTNVVAVEIHQRSGSSSDISFNFSLEGSGGTNKTSPLSTVENPEEETNIPQELGLKVFPNPTTGLVNIIYKGKVQGEVRFRVTNFNGHVMVDETYSEFTGEFTTTINLGKNAKGVYLLEIINGEETISEKLILD